MLEFVLLLPFLMVLFFVILDFGLALDHRIVVQQAVREGARQGATGLAGDEADIKDYVVEQSDGVLQPADVSVCFIDDGGNSASPGDVGDYVKVSVDYLYKFRIGSNELLPVFGINPDDVSITMSPYAVSRLERSVSGASSC